MLSTRPVLLLVLLLTFSQHCTTALPTPTECCFHYAQKNVRLANIRSFYETPKNCALPAVVIVTASGVKVCTDPQKPWVKKAINKLRRKK
ncbi:C-C motif chemokine 4-like [Anser cygnoides]|nr:C-C motif chemokine 4-like [Anser cygnoides]